MNCPYSTPYVETLAINVFRRSLVSYFPSATLVEWFNGK